MLRDAVNCRKQKMKCRLDNGSTCRRCSRAGVPCIFVPRANAAGLPAPVSVVVERARDAMSSDILQRLKAIEDHLGFGFGGSSSDAATVSPAFDGDEDDGDSNSLATLWAALRVLRRCGPPSVNPVIWQRNTVKYLWQTRVALGEYAELKLTSIADSTIACQAYTSSPIDRGSPHPNPCSWRLSSTAQAFGASRTWPPSPLTTSRYSATPLLS